MYDCLKLNLHLITYIIYIYIMLPMEELYVCMKLVSIKITQEHSKVILTFLIFSHLPSPVV